MIFHIYGQSYILCAWAGSTLYGHNMLSRDHQVVLIPSSLQRSLEKQHATTDPASIPPID